MEYSFSAIQAISPSVGINLLCAVIGELFPLPPALICEFNFHCVTTVIKGKACFITWERLLLCVDPRSIPVFPLMCYVTLGAIFGIFVKALTSAHVYLTVI